MEMLYDVFHKDGYINDYCCSGVLDGVPTIEIAASAAAAAGKLTLSSFPVAAGAATRALLDRCEAAPFGLGEQTVHDTKVRHGWQLTPDKFTLQEANSWGGLTETSASSSDCELLETIRQSLAPKCPTITSELNKLLVYEKGNHFAAHVDTQRSATHFATLLVFLPSQYTGGDFLVRHLEDEKCFNFSVKSKSKKASSSCQWVAFFTDCEHEVKPVLSGTRLVLQFHLFFGLNHVRPEPPRVDLSTKLTMLLDSILDDKDVDPEELKKKNWWRGKTPIPAESIGFLLEHQYSKSSLKPHLLKGNDEHMYNILQSVRDAYELELKSIIIDVSGHSGESDSERKASRAFSSCENYDDAEAIIYDVDADDEPQQAAKRPRHHYSTFGSGSRALECPPGAEIARIGSEFYGEGCSKVLFVQCPDNGIKEHIKNLKSYKSRTQPTGNEGTAFELQYKHAALILTPLPRDEDEDEEDDDDDESGIDSDEEGEEEEPEEAPAAAAAFQPSKSKKRAADRK